MNTIVVSWKEQHEQAFERSHCNYLHRTYYWLVVRYQCLRDSSRRRDTVRRQPSVCGDSYDESYEITPFERGRCTDSYSKAWCNSHGFKNNRPVPHKVQLNAKERKCLNELYVNGTASVIAGYISTGAGGALFATAQAAYRLFNCLF